MSDNHPDLIRHLLDNEGFLERQIRKHADGLVLARESVSDLMQSISRELIEEKSAFEYRSVEEFRAWLQRVVCSKLIDRRRYYTAKKRDVEREQEHSTSDAAVDRTPSVHAMREERRHRVAAAIERLPEDYQTVLRLFWFEGLSHPEIAARMGRPETATRKLLSRAKAKLAIEIGSDDMGPFVGETPGADG